MHVLEHAPREEEGMQEEKIEVQPQDLVDKKFEDLMAMMWTIAEKMQIQNEWADKKEAQKGTQGRRKALGCLKIRDLLLVKKGS